FAQLDVALEHVAVWKPERQPAAALVPFGANLDERRELLAVQQPSVLADQVEPAVLAGAEGLQPDRLALLGGERPDGSGGDPDDARGHVVQCYRQAGSPSLHLRLESSLANPKGGRPCASRYCTVRRSTGRGGGSSPSVH